MAYFRGDPSKYIIKFVDGKRRRAGLGLSFFYFKMNTSIAAIPALTNDSGFVFNEITKNKQAVTLQGRFTYRIKDPKKMATILDFQIHPRTRQYQTDDPEKLELRIRNVIQVRTRSEIEKMVLEDALVASEKLTSVVLESVEGQPIIKEMGIDILSISFLAITPTPEIARALEAEYREKLQMKADEAIYDRRAAAVEQESKIKENELNSQIALEKKRKELIALEGANIIKEAEFQAKAKETELSAYKKLAPNVLLALALKELGENAEKIDTLTITPDILASILKESKK
ncbi:MAG: SPFH domain-containing protein [Candidatus Heimdallarchaeota archaeon]|nr:SPFH domain-containing protein [Candidatus Heimdallarchaeota archaeon]MCK5299412.1 SPFH domain-containing protein [Candidatus Heimdallarchaeota archaeon]